MSEHLYSRIPMAVRIDLVKTMRQHSHCLVAIAQCLPVCTDIHTVGQTADHEYLWTHLSEIGHQPTDQVFAVLRTLTGAHDAYDSRLVQIRIASEIDDEGRIGTLTKALRVVVIHRCQGADLMLLHECQFKFCPFHRFAPVFQGFHQSR